MIKVENIETWGLDAAIRGCRNPLNSWQKSDSYWGKTGFTLGENDLQLMQRLYKAGVEHRTFARMLMCSMDITAPLYLWKEADRYTVGKTQISTSTMHTIHKKPFELDDFSHDHLSESGLEGLEYIIKKLNEARKLYLADGIDPKKYWWDMIQLLPSSYNQIRTVMMSYEVVFKILKERSNHKLDEWIEFCQILRKLPYIKEIMDEGERNV